MSALIYRLIGRGKRGSRRGRIRQILIKIYEANQEGIDYVRV